MRGLRKCTFYATAFAAAAVWAGAAAQANQLLNPGFESPNASGGDVPGSTSWGSFNNTFTTISVSPHSGSQTLKLFGPFSQFGGSGVTQSVPAAPGQSWEASAWFRNDSSDAMQGTNFAVAQLQFLDSSNAVITDTDSSQFNALSDPQNTWAQRIVDAVAPAGTVKAQIVLVHVQLNNPATGGSVFIDDASLDRVPEPASVASAAGVVALASLRRRSRRA